MGRRSVVRPSSLARAYSKPRGDRSESFVTIRQSFPDTPPSYSSYRRLNGSSSKNLAEKLDSAERKIDFYQLLGVSRDASPAIIKAAYHRALLRSHPDKQNAHNLTKPVDIALIKEAYNVLSDNELRAAHDALLNRRLYTAGPRPAQVVSLEEFEDESSPEAAAEEEGPWRYSCRCGGQYRITVSLMEKGEHLIACNSCSEVIWVGYELAELPS